MESDLQRLLDEYDSDGVARGLQQYIHLYHAERNRQALHNRPWWDKALDRLAYLLMDVAALISWPVWSKPKIEERQAYAQLPPESELPFAEVLGSGLFRWWVHPWYQDDGWRPGRYV